MVHIIKIQTDDDNLVWERNHESDTCFDIKSNEDFKVKAGEFKTIDTGVRIGIPKGYWVRIEPRSGLACRSGVHIGAGVIDEEYIGTINVMFFNQGKKTLKFKKYDRIAQARLVKREDFKFKRVNDLEGTKRGSKGLGSSGVK